jgi:hypothetical protein
LQNVRIRPLAVVVVLAALSLGLRLVTAFENQKRRQALCLQHIHQSPSGLPSVDPRSARSRLRFSAASFAASKGIIIFMLWLLKKQTIFGMLKGLL